MKYYKCKRSDMREFTPGEIYSEDSIGVVTDRSTVGELVEMCSSNWEETDLSLKGSWYVVVTEENAAILSSWRGNVLLTADHLVGSAGTGCKEHNPRTSSEEFGTEITFEQFKEFVLKTEVVKVPGFKQRLSKDPVVKYLRDIIAEQKERKSSSNKIESKSGLFSCKMTLVGGAVIDILEDRTPKDYDIDGWNQDFELYLIRDGWKISSVTSTARSYVKGNNLIQLLTKKKREDFDFQISKSSYCFNTDRVEIEEYDFEHKILIPNSFNQRDAANCLLRIPHWRKKGYTMSEETYMSLVRSATKSRQSLES